MTFKHGVSVVEQATSILAPTPATSGIPFAVGTAPVNLASNPVPVNTPVLAYTYAEAVSALGYSDKWEDFTLCELIYSHFALYAKAPLILVNVLDPATHKTTVAPAAVTVSNKVATLAVDGIILSSIIVKSADGATTYTPADFTAAFNDTGHVVVTTKGTIPANATQLQIGYNKLNPSAVDADDIIGGVTAGGAYTGFELVNQAYPRFGVLPDLLVAPGWSHFPTVAAVMKAKAANINGNFKAMALTDIDPSKPYTDAGAWKSDNNYTDALQIPTYLMLSLGEKRFHYSSQLAGLIARTDSENGGIPYVSPSNKALQADGTVLADGSDQYLGIDQASYLNSLGIVTAVNLGASGWRSWGNSTGAYPNNTDPKDSFIPIRRMFNWIGNSLILTYMQKVDDPLNKRLIAAVTDSVNIWLNGLTASGALLGGRVEFLEAENPITSLMAGKIKFHLFITPPGPAQEIEFLLEYDTSYLAALFA
ncbi:phage tail sheath family protein [Paenibacillus contaminans]|uniref:Phage tail sheath family protein n=1 Tax=Paenibacillus contaminans TaxID=450362 RepID=A0A329MG89_9BACL|nr:phage tail sheath family protein [Paenibacillus contaminans]RAV18830.1 phage tail sheath family protein [Paenibacillus contaminans]